MLKDRVYSDFRNVSDFRETEISIGDTIITNLGKYLFVQAGPESYKLIDIESGDRHTDHDFPRITSIKEIEQLSLITASGVLKKGNCLFLHHPKSRPIKFGDIIKTNKGNFLIGDNDCSIGLVNIDTGVSTKISFRSEAITFCKLESIMKTMLNFEDIFIKGVWSKQTP